MHKERKRKFVDGVFCFLGIVGTVGCFLTMYPLPISSFLLIVLLLCTSAFLYSIYEHTQKKRLPIACIIYLFIAITTYPLWKNGLAYIMNTIFSVYESNSQYAFQRFSITDNLLNQTYILYITCWLLFTPMCLIVIRTIRCLHSFSLGFIVTSPFIFSILLFTLRPDPTYFIMVILFWLTLAGMGTAGHKKVHVHPQTLQHFGVVFASSGLVLILLLQCFFPDTAYVRNANVENMRVSIQTKIRNLIEGSYDQTIGEIDLRSAKDRYYLGSDQIQLEMEEPQTVYLHGYSSSNYQDNRWFNEDKPTSYQMNDLNVIHPMNFALLESSEIPKVSMTLTYKNKELPYFYTPYYLLDDLREDYAVHQDTYVEHKGDLQDFYTFRIANVEDVDTTTMELQNFQKEYMERVRDDNLHVPMLLQNTINTLTIDGISSAFNEQEKIAAIQNFMVNFGSYTLRPGATPEGEDFIKYFLTKSKQGYCVHYASSAVMLLRYYGIPARYASGYRIDQGDFVDGMAIAKDYQEHAWVEILDPVFGWVPLEVTPAGGPSNQNPTPNAPDQTQNPTQSNQSPNQTTPNQTQKDPSNGTKDSMTNDHYEIYIYIGIGFVVLLILGGTAMRRTFRLQKQRQAMTQTDKQKAILACGAYLEGLEESMDIPMQIQTYLDEAKYSNHEMMDVDLQPILRYCETRTREHLAHTTWTQRFIERYIYCKYK